MTKLVQVVLDRTVRLDRVAAGLAADADGALVDLRKRVLGELVAGERGSGGSVGALVAARFDRVLAELTGALRSVRADQVGFTRKELARAAGRTLLFREDKVGPLPEVMGASFEDWFGRIRDDLELKVEASVRRLFATDPDPDLPTDFLMREFSVAVTALDALIRTMVQAIANRVMREVASRSLPEVGWQQVSVLDSRTSRVCQDYAFKEWDSQFRPIGHDLPFQDGTPRHWNCRAVIVPAVAGLSR